MTGPGASGSHGRDGTGAHITVGAGWHPLLPLPALVAQGIERRLRKPDRCGSESRRGRDRDQRVYKSDTVTVQPACGLRPQGVDQVPREDEFQILRSANRGYYWHLKATNNEIVCSSQVYTTKEACIRGANWVRNNAASAKVYDYSRT